MKKKLMIKQEAQIFNFMQKKITETPRIVFGTEVTKFTIDSVVNNAFRLIICKLKEPLFINSEMFKEKKKKFSKEFAKFDIWKRTGTEEVLLKDAFSRLGVKKPKIKEGKVFVKFENKTFEITEYVRQVVKNHYLPLLKRESYQIKIGGN